MIGYPSRIQILLLYITLCGHKIPNKQKPVKNTRLFGVFHTSDPSLSCDNSRVAEVIVNDLITGLGPSFYTVKT